MSRLAAILAIAVALPAAAQESSPRPEPRVITSTSNQVDSVIAEATANPLARPEGLAAISPRQGAFEDWLAQFRGRALVQGVRRDVVDAAISGLAYDDAVIARDRNQAEFSKTIWQYLDAAVSDTRVTSGQAALEQYAEIFEAIEAKYGVEKEVVAAVWGMESNYGTHRGDTSLVDALATLAFDGRRGSFFETQLVAALKIIESGDVTTDAMKGSWAGAMGHTQFIPTSYLVHAVDFTGDGKRDIWSDDPTDALASTAAYLAGFGWTEGQPWGVEVQLPEDFDFTQARRAVKKTPAEWGALGVTDMTGATVTENAEASILVPAGSAGAAFMIFPNFEVIERYNTADAYVIGVGHLSDRLAGGAPIQADWPRDDRALSSAEKEELQRRLTSAGFDTAGIDGRIGPRTIAAVRAYQQASGMVPDGFASLTVLQSLRGS